MSELQRAVLGEVDSYTPEAGPRFPELQALSRARRRRRTLVSILACAAALSVVAVGSATVLFAGGSRAARTASQELQGSEESPPGTSVDYRVRSDVGGASAPGTQHALGHCLTMPGVTYSKKPDASPPEFQVHAEAEADSAFVSCVATVSYYNLELGGSPETGDLDEGALHALGDRLNAEEGAVHAAGVMVASYGPDPARGLLRVEVAGDLAQADRVLRERLGDGFFVVHAPGLPAPANG